METTFILDVAEHALKKLERHSSVLLIERKKLFEEFLELYGDQYRGCNFKIYRGAISTAFPIYKNNHKKFQYFKISEFVPRLALRKKGMNLRPVNHVVRAGAYGREGNSS
jgi:hypothetical protein